MLEMPEIDQTLTPDKPIEPVSNQLETPPVQQENSAETTEKADKPRAVKKPFDAECNKCHKHFKTKNVFEKHVEQQLCYSKNEISYCKTCNITLDTHAGYVKHLMTAEHLAKIGRAHV